MSARKKELLKDAHLRGALLTKLHRLHETETETLIVEELGVCQGEARLDIAVINGALLGYEIKSESDRLTRLPSQRDIFNRVVDRMTLVTSPNHLTEARSLVPKWWGLLVTCWNGDDLALKHVRKARPNLHVDPAAYVQLLWRNEAMDILNSLGISTGLTRKPRRILWERLVNSLTKKELSAIVRQKLRQRTSWRPAPRHTSGDDSSPSAAIS